MSVSEILAKPQEEEKEAALEGLFASWVQEGNLASLEAMFSEVLNSSEKVAFKRKFSRFFAEGLQGIDAQENEVIDMCTRLLAVVKEFSSTASFPFVDYLLRKTAFKAAMNVGAFAEGADLLAASNFEDSTVSQQVGDVGLCEDYVTIAEAYLAENGTVEAEGFVRRAWRWLEGYSRSSSSSAASSKEADEEDGTVQAEDMALLVLRAKVIAAKTLEGNRKFREASAKYYELARSTGLRIATSDLYDIFSKAIVCGLLSQPFHGSHYKLLSLLEQDPLFEALGADPDFSPLTSLLSKACHRHILQAEDLSYLMELIGDNENQKPRTSFGILLPEQRFLEHNLISLSHTYESISFDMLVILLKQEESIILAILNSLLSTSALEGCRVREKDRLVCFRQAPSSQTHTTGFLQRICEGLKEEA